jgi:hypothetical protein
MRKVEAWAKVYIGSPEDGVVDSLKQCIYCHKSSGNVLLPAFLGKGRHEAGGIL